MLMIMRSNSAFISSSILLTFVVDFEWHVRCEQIVSTDLGEHFGSVFVHRLQPEQF